MGEAEFWTLTPAFLEKMYGVWSQQQEAIAFEDDYRAAILTTWFANANRDVKRHPKGFGFSHYFPRLKRLDGDVEEKQEQDVDTVLGVLKTWSQFTGIPFQETENAARRN